MTHINAKKPMTTKTRYWITFKGKTTEVTSPKSMPQLGEEFAQQQAIQEFGEGALVSHCTYCRPQINRELGKRPDDEWVGGDSDLHCRVEFDASIQSKSSEGVGKMLYFYLYTYDPAIL
jgi:hypothetical protein